MIPPWLHRPYDSWCVCTATESLLLHKLPHVDNGKHPLSGSCMHCTMMSSAAYHGFPTGAVRGHMHGRGDQSFRPSCHIISTSVLWEVASKAHKTLSQPRQTATLFQKEHDKKKKKKEKFCKDCPSCSCTSISYTYRSEWCSIRTKLFTIQTVEVCAGELKIRQPCQSCF